MFTFKILYILLSHSHSSCSQVYSHDQHHQYYLCHRGYVDPSSQKHHHHVRVFVLPNSIETRNNFTRHQMFPLLITKDLIDTNYIIIYSIPYYQQYQFDLYSIPHHPFPTLQQQPFPKTHHHIIHLLSPPTPTSP